MRDAPLRILLLSDYPNDPRLGSSKVPHKLQREFRELGHHCDALFREDLGHANTPSRLRMALGPLFAAQAARAAVDRNGPYDVIDAASAEGFIVGLRRRAWPATAIVSRSNGLEHLDFQRMLDDHAAGLRPKPWTRRIWFPAVRMTQVRAAARIADRLLLLTEVDRAFARAHRWKSDDRIDVVPHGVSTRFLDNTPSPDVPRGGGILFCGSWTEVKGIDFLPRAFALLVAQGLRTNLTILGGGYPEAYIRSAFSQDVQPYLTVIPRVGEDDVIAEYRRHDMMVMCSTYEGFSMVVIEAMSQGLPVVATPVGCASTLVRDGETGVRVRIRDPESLAAGIRRMLDDPEGRARMAARALDAVRGMTWTTTAEQTLDVYRRAMAQRTRA